MPHDNRYITFQDDEGVTLSLPEVLDSDSGGRKPSSGAQAPASEVADVNFNRQRLVKKSAYYELWRDETDGLEYVRFKAEGLRKIAKKYKDQKRVQIEVSEQKIDSDDHFYTRGSNHSPESLLQKLQEMARGLRDGESKGLIHLFSNKGGYVMHAAPFLVTKVAGKVVVSDFEGHLAGGAGLPSEFSVKQVSGYRDAQKDNHSCTVFAIDTLKNCLMNKGFLAEVAKDGSVLACPKMALGQGRDFAAGLPQDKKKKYVLGGLEGVNRKAIYKGHDYARLINPRHRELLGEETRDVLQFVDQAREAAKKARQIEPVVTSSEVTPPLPQVPQPPLPQVSDPDAALSGPALNPGASTKATSCYNPKLSQEIVLINSPAVKSQNIWFLYQDRGNKYKADSRIYKKGSDYSDASNPGNRDVDKALINAIVDAAHRSGLVDRNGVLDIDLIDKVIALAKTKGGINNRAISGTEYEIDKKLRVEDEASKKFSKYFQENTKKCGIYSGRGASEVGLRLTFLPESVIAKFSESGFTAPSKDAAKDFIAEKSKIINPQGRSSGR